jgi:2,4-dienoyl-CoA reductase-like NADH-dependent reductase (Old Yellow Enzyme family)/thioredoxin reductase
MEELVKQWSLGGLSLRNRIFMAPVKTAFGTPDGRVTERHLHFYRAVAGGGAALVILEPVSVTGEGREHPKQLTIHNDYSAKELSKITAVLHESGAKACLNLNHAGRAANPKVTGLPPLAPSACSCAAKGTEARELAPEKITAIVEAFGDAARKAEEAGFDAIEIQAGHGYLLQQFMMAETNQRKDAYGKDPLRFAREVLGAVREASTLPVLVRVTRPLPFNPGADEKLRQLLKLAEEAGVAAVHAGMGDACAAPPWYYHHGSLPERPQEEALRFVRENTKLPVIAAGRMGGHERAKRLFDEGLMDAIALGRPLVADPALPAKWQQKAYDDVVECGSCLQGCLYNVANGKGISCIVNPTVGKPPMTPAEKKKRVLVVGAGPAGLSCAITLWKRGHGVIVAEASKEMGGTFRAAPLSFGKEAMQKPLRGLLRLVEREEIPIMRNQPVDEAFLRKINPEVLVWAAGSAQNVPPIPGLDKVPTLASLEFYLEGKRLAGKRVLVLGGGMVGIEAAETLAQDGHEVTIVEMLPELANNMEMVSRNLALKRINENRSIKVLLNATITSFDDGGVVVKNDNGEQRLPPFDWVLIAAGLKPKPLPEGFREIVKDIRVIGDANAVRDVESAAREGYETGLSV